MFELTLVEGNFVSLIFVVGIAGICYIANIIRNVFNIQLWED